MLSGRKRNARAAEGERALEPILVDYNGRDGSTLTMRLLATSPQIAVGGKYPYENKYLAYLYRWARLLDRREWPKGLWSGHHIASLAQEDYLPFMGPPPWIPRELLDPVRGGERISDYSFRTIWAEFSRRAAAHAGEQRGTPGPDLRYYAEKHMHSRMAKLDHLPPVRLLALLRDPRDTYLSIAAFRQRGFAMGGRPGETSEAWLARYLKNQRDRMRWIELELRNGTMPVFRYEDLVLDLPGQARRIEDWLGVTIDLAAVAKDNRLRAHATADTPQSSIGRWHTEMPVELARRFNDELGDELKALGFDVPGPQPLRQPKALAVGTAKASRQTPQTLPDGEHENREELRGPPEAVEDAQQEPREALIPVNDDRARLRAALESATIEKVQLQRQLNETERWLRNLEGSRSWRITRPLRAAGAVFWRLSRWPTAPSGRRV